ncbi:MAG: helix-turn-helix domain-containing protein [Rhodobacterales bacterium]|nr:helix-turn-helix domain-containing protein [Rhodobacterales bacterium]
MKRPRGFSVCRLSESVDLFLKRTCGGRDAALAKAVVTEVAQCYRSVIKNRKDLKLRISLECLADYLLRQKFQAGSLDFDLNIEKRRLASFLGMTPENLSCAFKALEP